MKKVINNQKYENYWKITLEYSDIFGEPFNNVLKIFLDYIDKNIDVNLGMNPKQYKELQFIVESQYPKKDSASTRKSINQFYKLGFINNGTKGYHYLSKDFIREKNKERKKMLYSKIVYENSSFSRSFSNFSNNNEIKFLIKTLEECGTLSKDQLIALLYTDIDLYKKGFLNKQELDSKYKEVLHNDGLKRKYNQRNYLLNLCTNLSDIYICNGIMSLDKKIILDFNETIKHRDNYLQRLYKIELINECKTLYNLENAWCCLEKISYPILIASHIKPYRFCNPSEQFDKNNGLLLSKNFDSLFDLGYISFDNDGNILTSSLLDDDVSRYVKQYKLDDLIYNDERRKYMEFHRKHIFKV